MNAALPVPAYLPENFSMTAIYALEHTDSIEFLAITFYLKKNEDGGVTKIEEAPIRMYVKLLRGGQFGGLNPQNPGSLYLHSRPLKTSQ